MCSLPFGVSHSDICHARCHVAGLLLLVRRGKEVWWGQKKGRDNIWTQKIRNSQSTGIEGVSVNTALSHNGEGNTAI